MSDNVGALPVPLDALETPAALLAPESFALRAANAAFLKLTRRKPEDPEPSALAELLLAPDLLELEHALLEGYQVHRALAQEDIDMLPLFLLIRGMALIGWYHERPEHAGDDYFDEVKAWVLEQCAP